MSSENSDTGKASASSPTKTLMRLSSMRTRDLTLGAGPSLTAALRGGNKRIFTPTIPVRNVNKPSSSQGDNISVDSMTSGTSSASEIETSKNGNTDRGRGRGRGRGDNRGRGRGRGKPVTIQSEGGVFAAGPAERTVRQQPRAEASYSRDGGGGGASSNRGARISRVKETDRLSKMNVDLKLTMTKEEEMEFIDEFLADDFLDDDNLENKDDKTMPMSLPMLELSLKTESKSVTKPIVPERRKKKKFNRIVESDSDEEDEKMDVDSKPDMGPNSDQDTKRLQSVLFSDHGGADSEYFLIQLPQCMPGYPPGDDTGPPAKVKSDPGTSATATAPIHVESDSANSKICSLRDMNEGRLGKLQLLKSGKMRLVIDQLKFDIEEGTNVSFLQELVSLKIRDDRSEGDLIVLGNIEHQLICTPQLDTLLQLT